MARYLNVSLKRFHAIEVTRIAIGNQKLVYVLTANRKFKYPHGKSFIAYIGTTKRGIRRVASSAASHSEDILSEYGVKKITARIIVCKRRPNVKTWVKLERALLLVFREIYGEVPTFNLQGHKIKETDGFDYFKREKLRKVLIELA
ncbi:MAG: hypothetical protein HY244_05445 [Rhizobiales bacterium]|nr:hypothetical protein [Hyphomicrobiales bacterium]